MTLGIVTSCTVPNRVGCVADVEDDSTGDETLFWNEDSEVRIKR